MGRGALFMIACPAIQDDAILGWTCSEVKDEQTVLHYMYIKDPFIGKGVDDVLLAALPGTKPGIITHNQGNKRLKDWRWIPEIARRKDL